jgi:hypothetical protein
MYAHILQAVSFQISIFHLISQKHATCPVHLVALYLITRITGRFRDFVKAPLARAELFRADRERCKPSLQILAASCTNLICGQPITASLIHFDRKRLVVEQVNRDERADGLALGNTTCRAVAQ